MSQLPRVLVCGSREFDNPFLASLTIDDAIGQLDGKHEILHGAARGADTIAAEAASRSGHIVRAFPARWEADGKRAGILRNLRMLDERPDWVLAFWNGRSRGTAHTVTEAQKRGIRTHIVHIKADSTGVSPSITAPLASDDRQ